jgi:DNA-binding response OmpR family regulator
VTKPILVVEDDETNATVICDYLASVGYEVSLARDGDEALRAFATSPPALVILDLLLPARSGFDVIRAIRAGQVGSGVPVVLMSAVGAETYAEAFAEVRALAQGFLRKPFSMAAMADRVQQIIGPA